MTTDQMNLPFVSILMPVRNERDFIEGSLGSVLAQDYPIDRLEILVVDGMSDDGTREYVERCAVNNRQPTLTLLDNPKKIVATAMNIGMRSARGGIILRVDGHCEISPGHLRHCVERLTATRNVPAGVGGPVETVSESVVGRAIAAAMSSRFGVGGSSFRIGVETERFADTVPFPAYTLTTIEAAGPYDEELVRNQDDEYNYRIRGLGGDLLLDPALRSRYYSRASLRKLWRQYFQYGYWKVRVLQKHPKQMSLRQFVPAALVVAIVGSRDPFDCHAWFESSRGLGALGLSGRHGGSVSVDRRPAGPSATVDLASCVSGPASGLWSGVLDRASEVLEPMG